MRKKSIFLWGKETLYIFFEYFQQKCTHTTYTFGFSKINDKIFSDRTFFHSLHRIRSSSFDFSTRRATGQANTTMSLLNVCDFQNELVTDNFDRIWIFFSPLNEERQQVSQQDSFWLNVDKIDLSFEWPIMDAQTRWRPKQ